MDIFFDIETIPQQPEEEAKALIAETIKAPATMSKPETIEAWHKGEGKYANAKRNTIEKAYRDTSFDGAKGEICSIAWAVEDGSINNMAACDGATEADMIDFFFNSVFMECQKKQPFFIGHYIGGFDLKFLWKRAVIHNMKPPFAFPVNGRHGKDFFCTMTEWAGYKDTVSMDNLAKALGIEGKGDMDGSMVWDTWDAGDYNKVRDYNASDVEIVREIYNRLTFRG